MGGGEFVKLRCLPGTLEGLARALTRFGAAPGLPDWLVSGVWLCSDEAQYLATATVEVLPDGFVARSLCITAPDDFSDHLHAELPDLSARLRSRGHGSGLPPVDPPSAPASLKTWPFRTYSMVVLVRASERERGINRIACGLLFRARQHMLLVGTDPTTLAMVLSEDEELIERYGRGCEELLLEDYLAAAGT